MTNARVDMSSVSAARLRYAADGWKNLTKSKADASMARQVVPHLLWVAFPSKTESDLCKSAAQAFGVTPKTVWNWLNGVTDAPGRVVLQSLVLAQAEVIFKKIEAGHER